MADRSPQEKKHLSYLHDRRNDYGENDKSSRKAIPARKRWVVRSYRRATKQQLPKNALTGPLDDLAEAEGKVLSVRRKSWKKWPDVPLGEYLARKADRRARWASDTEKPS
jgi:hypothetical protein